MGGCLRDDLVRMQPHGSSTRIAMPISESATFVNVMARSTTKCNKDLGGNAEQRSLIGDTG